MNIKAVENDLRRALQFASAGKFLQAARLFVAVMRWAPQCRAERKHLVGFAATHGLSLALTRLYAESTDPAERSEAGRIKAEARALLTLDTAHEPPARPLRHS